MNRQELTNRIKSKALEIGFDLVGVCPAESFSENQFYKQWLTRGYAGQMGYMERSSSKRADVTRVLAGAKSVICCAVNYNTDYPYSAGLADPSRGWISRYAWGDDYHDSLIYMLGQLDGYCKEVCGDAFGSKYYVDTGPVLEKVYSRYSGIGWIGKNTCLINQQAGSWLFLGEIITDMELEYDSGASDRCGTCTECIDSCPTGAIVEPYVLDARRCISYLTIELKESIPAGLREGMENNIYGCDICQDVCPWNREADVTDKPEFQPRTQFYNPPLSDLTELTRDDFSRLFRASPMKRAKRRGLLRNVLIAMGNSGDRGFAGKVRGCLKDDEPVVRAAAVWAYWKLCGEEAKRDLSFMLESETDKVVRDEIVSILN